MTPPETSTERQRVLFLSNLPLHPEHPNGFSARWHSLLTGVGNHFDLYVVSVRSPENQGVTTDEMMVPRHLSRSVRILDEVPERSSRLWRIIRGAAVLGGLSAAGVQVPGLAAAIRDLPKLDLVIVLLPYLGEFTLTLGLSSPVLFAAEEWWQRNWDGSLAGTGRSQLRKAWLAVTRYPYRWRSRRLVKEFGRRGHILAISELERDYFARWASKASISVIPLGIDSTFYAPQGDASEEFDIGIFGALADERNYRPAREFFDAVSALPEGRDLRWIFVGRDPHPCIASLASRKVLVTGAVPETRSYYGRVRVVVAPSRVGSGAKTTVLKACSMGKPVVATPFSASGIPLQPGRDLIVGDSLDDMARQVTRLLGDSQARLEMGRAARAAIVRTCDDSLRAHELVALCERLISAASE